MSLAEMLTFWTPMRDNAQLYGKSYVVYLCPARLGKGIRASFALMATAGSLVTPFYGSMPTGYEISPCGVLLPMVTITCFVYYCLTPFV